MAIVNSIDDYYTLSNGVKMPGIAYGTWRMPEGRETETILNAIHSGYRLIDSAKAYGNEKYVGEAVKKSGVKREELFVTTKLDNDDRGYDNILRAFDASLERLDMEYVDLYLIHWPIPLEHKADWIQLNVETWKAMEAIYKSGKARAIGVSNFLVHHMQHLLDTAEILPMVNQLEVHPCYQPDWTVAFCKGLGMIVESCFPLMSGELLQEPLVKYLAGKYGKTESQIGLRWHIQKGLVPVAKAASVAHMQNNLELFDFELAPEDMIMLDTLRSKGRCKLALCPDDFPEVKPVKD